ncbi:DUF975 family protein [Companilactobacillus allii]|uniref:Beta-carotene 15,15'-monooxygenase n=1 Tax=Companilactobacillus allii TaxID=1847728 RepID=A0A1P8Q0B1_9LACO|nr:DUF975 family protein [Companilactobacillus allii]APX71265.1 hypothetical protein BTM29_01280 [Companilactobacillus allii]USQ68347.1 DUF975 family protein [Companilactobacillus allii]
MNNYKRVNSLEVRRLAMRTFLKDIKGNVALNIFPILMRLVAMYFGTRIYNSWLGELGVSFSNPQEASERLSEISQQMANDPSAATKYALSLTPGSSVIIFAFLFFFVLVCTGVGYTMLDKMRHPNLEINALKDSLQVFSSRFFFPVLFITAMLGVFVEAGLSLYIIPGIWFFLIFSQSFYILKDDVDKNKTWSIRATFLSLAKSSRLMRGHKTTLFFICFEFLLWEIVNLMTHEILSIWLHPYEQLTLAAFYAKISEVDKANRAKAAA